MSDRSGQQIVLLIIILWWQKLGRDWQCVNKQHRVHMERFSLEKSNEVERKEHYCVESSK
jgi:hypothetical protein